jgi:hypothetical protein
MTLNSIKNNLKFVASNFPWAATAIFSAGVLVGHILQRFTG